MDSPAPRPRSLVECLANVQDPRIDRKKERKLIDVLVIAVCAFICGGEHWTDCEEFGKSKEAWFRTFLELKNGCFPGVYGYPTVLLPLTRAHAAANGRRRGWRAM